MCLSGFIFGIINWGVWTLYWEYQSGTITIIFGPFVLCVFFIILGFISSAARLYYRMLRAKTPPTNNQTSNSKNSIDNICPVCSYQNSASDAMCSSCGSILNKEIYQKMRRSGAKLAYFALLLLATIWYAAFLLLSKTMGDGQGNITLGIYGVAIAPLLLILLIKIVVKFIKN